MNPGSTSPKSPVLSATLAASAMIAFQVASKATRDALFLSSFQVTDLPVMVFVAAVFSLLIIFPTTSALSRFGPARVLPASFLASAVLALLEWGLVGVAPRPAAVLVYLHLAGFGAVLVSGFWSLISERFDPRTAKKQIGRIAAGATFGGLLGGLVAERVGGISSLSNMLPILSGFHIFCAWRTHALGSADRTVQERSSETETSTMETVMAPLKGLQTVHRTPYLRNLAVVVLLASLSAALLDYVLKDNAVQNLASGENLLRFFAVFYTGISLFTLLVQTTLSRRVLESMGLARATGFLPASVALGSFAGLLFPGLASATAARGVQSVVHHSIFRSGYELLYTPLPANQKRTTKAIIDVGFDRAGDAAGAGLIQIFLILIPQFSSGVLLWAAIAVAFVSLWITSMLHSGYVKSLEQSLEARSIDLDEGMVADKTTRQTLMQTMGSLRLGKDFRRDMEKLSRKAVREIKPAQKDRSRGEEEAQNQGMEVEASFREPLDPLVRQILDLRSGDPKRIIPLLASEEPLPPSLGVHLVPLLAWDDVSERVIRALRRIAPRSTGLLVDALVDPESEFAVRRRIPRVLEACNSEQAAHGLLAGLQDKRFEVRYQCGRALARVLQRNPEVSIGEARVYDAVRREVAVDRRVWESQRLLDRMPSDDKTPFEDEYIRERAGRSLEHVFTVLSLVQPTESLMIAYRGIHTNDSHLRGTALEYLEIILPDDIRVKLWPFLEEQLVPEHKKRTREEVLSDLMESNQSIELNLKELRNTHREQGEEGKH